MAEITDRELMTLKLKYEFSTHSNPRLFWLIKLGEAQAEKRRIELDNKLETNEFFKVPLHFIEYKIKELEKTVGEFEP